MRSYVSADVPLLGKGLVYRPSEDFGPGEFKTLINVDVVPDGLRVRRHWKNVGSRSTNSVRARISGVIAEASDPGGYYAIPDLAAIHLSGRKRTSNLGISPAGNIADGYVIQGKTIAVTVNALDNSGVFDSKFSFVYNRKTYRIGYRYTNPGADADPWDVSKEWFAYRDGSGSNITNPTTTTSQLLPTGVFSTGVNPGTLSTSSDDDSEFVCGLVWKDRAWVFMTNKVAYSKATDPWVWDTTDGAGFFKLPDEIIMDAFIFRDTMIIITKSNIWQFSFTVDPGTDGFLRVLVNGKGGFAGCEARGQAFISCEDGLYTINNGYLSLIADTRLNDTRVFTEHKVVLFSDSLILVKTDMVKNSTYDLTFSRTFSLNLDTGGLSEYVLDGGAGTGLLYDIATVFEPNQEEALYGVVANGATTEIYYMKANRFVSENTTGVDERAGTTAQNVPWTIELTSFLADGLAYQWKKLRQLFFVGSVKPNAHGIDLSLGFTEADAYQKTDTFQPPTEAGTWRYPRPYRMSMLQRCRAISFRFRSNTTRSANSSLFYMTELKFLWTPTNRQQSYRVGDDQV